jgi:large repetitive protein
MTPWKTALATLVLALAFGAGMAYAEPIGPDNCPNQSCLGVQYTLAFLQIDDDTVQITYTANAERGERDVIFAIAFKVAESVAGARLDAAPAGWGHDARPNAGLTENGCSGLNSANGFVCSQGDVRLPVGFPGNIYTWVFTVDLQGPVADELFTDPLEAHVMAAFIPRAITSEDITLSVVTVGSADLRVTKTGPAESVTGSLVAYTITVTNAGPSDAEAVQLLDPAPAGLSFVSATAPCAGGFPCELGSLAAGFSKDVTVIFQVTFVGPGRIVNTATATSPTTPDPVLANNDGSTSTSNLVALRSADLQVTKTGPATAVAGGLVEHTITVTNAGPLAAQAVQLLDLVPDGLSFVSATAPCAGGFPCALGPLAAGAPALEVTVTFQVSPAFAGPGPIVNTAVATSPTTPDPDPANNIGPASTMIEVSADVQVSKTGSATAVAGGLVAYTITVTNAGPSDAEAVQLFDLVPAGLSFVSATAPCAGGGVPCALGSLAAGASVEVTATFQVSPTFAGPGPIVNTAAAASPTTPDPVLANNVGLASTEIEVPPPMVSADLQVTQTGPATAVAGGLVAYTITVTNAGPSAAPAVQLFDPAPDGLSFVSATAPCAGGFPCELGSLAAGAPALEVTATFQVSPAFAGPGPIVNTAVATSPTTPDPDPANNVGSASTVIEVPLPMVSADVQVSKTGSATAVAGGLVAYTIAVANLGPQPATAVQVTDSTPPGLAFVSNAGACVTPFPCDLGTLGVGETRTIVSTFTIAEPFTGPNPLVNVAVVSAAEADPVPANNTASARTAVSGAPVADIEVLKVLTMDGASGLAVLPGQAVTFWVKAANLGSSAATGVEVTDVLPPGLTFVSAVATQGSYEPGTGVWSVGELAVGAMAVLDITAVVTQAGPLVNTAERRASTPPDPNPANDLSTATFEVAGAPPGLYVALNQAAFGPGQTLVLTATLRPGIAPALVDAYVVLELPDGSLLSLQLGGGLVRGIAPLARGFQPFPGTGELLRYRFTGGEPAGAYRVRTALTLAGTGMIFGTIEDTRFTVGP